VLITAKAALDALLKPPAYISTASLAEMLLILELCNPPDLKTSRKLVQNLLDEGLVSFWKREYPGENKINTTRVTLTKSGNARLESLLRR